VALRAVLWDVGGPIDTEVISERLIDQHILEALAAEGFEVSGAELEAASEWAVSVFAPNAYAAMCWRLTGANAAAARRALAAVEAQVEERRTARGGIELRPGVDEVIRGLQRQFVTQGLAANQPATVLPVLDRLGIGQCFTHREVSGHHGFRKPDVRLFLRACEDLGVAPQECIMVGDRIDNDIAPARLLGMRTVRFRTGRHANQRPRSADELPDVEVRAAEALGAAIELLRRRALP
jgi:putative hydrolase of the HAD superfamily